MTLAEQAVAQFKAATKTTSLTAIARKTATSGLIHRNPNITKFVFPDGSTLTIQGRGRNHTYTTGTVFKENDQ